MSMRHRSFAALLCAGPLVLASCEAGNGAAAWRLENLNPDTLRIAAGSGRMVEVVGRAQNAKAGAAVALGDGHVYLTGVASWNPQMENKMVRVVGQIRIEHTAPPPGDAIVAGLFGDIPYVDWRSITPLDDAGK